MSVNLINIKTYTDGKAAFLVGSLKQMGLPQIIDNHMISEMFSQVDANSFVRFGIKVQSVNFDTISKVLWGTYEVDCEEDGVIQIGYGYSKQKRQD
ncbi:hypothetical protein [Alkaliphilus serpentinus]|uniref:Uncharacterized protein n=1 Tax=Alkaliphilus serpentinus TaxID=1482731 RepID=A0A833HNT1_9FIRM|nr:hypothetical protein [Alkaliphilus serpentinus]KAB3529845.1 hypothetical protein F8153_08585 [Alkaliphilus serpentinus]